METKDQILIKDCTVCKQSKEVYYSSWGHLSPLCKPCYIELIGEEHEHISTNDNDYCPVTGLRYPFIAYLLNHSDNRSKAVITNVKPYLHQDQAHKAARYTLDNPHRIADTKITIFSVAMKAKSTFKIFNRTAVN